MHSHARTIVRWAVGRGGGAPCSVNHPGHHAGAHATHINHYGARHPRSARYPRSSRSAPCPRATHRVVERMGWTAGTTRGVGHLGLTHTETQRGTSRTTGGRRCMGSKNRQTTSATTSTTAVRQLLGSATAQTAPATTSTAPRGATVALPDSSLTPCAHLEACQRDVAVLPPVFALRGTAPRDASRSAQVTVINYQRPLNQLSGITKLSAKHNPAHFAANRPAPGPGAAALPPVTSPASMTPVLPTSPTSGEPPSVAVTCGGMPLASQVPRLADNGMLCAVVVRTGAVALSWHLPMEFNSFAASGIAAGGCGPCCCVRTRLIVSLCCCPRAHVRGRVFVFA